MKKYFFTILAVGLFLQIHAQDLIKTADAFLLDAEYEKVIAFADKHSNETQFRSVLQNRKAEALIRLGKLDDAETLLKKLASETNDSNGITTQINLGFLNINLGRHDEAQKILESALQSLEHKKQSNSLDAAQALTYLGQVFKYTAKHAQAEQQLLMALSIRQRLLPENHELIAASFNDLGLMYATVDNDKALLNYEKALTIYKTLHGDDHPKIAIANSNLGFIYLNDKLYGDAVNYFETALKTWNKVYSQPHQSKAFVLFNLGETYSKMGDPKAADDFFQKSLDMYRNTYGNKHPEIATVLNSIGLLQASKGNVDLALRNYQEALQANVSDFSNNEISINPVMDKYYNGNILLYTLLLKAQGLENRYFSKTLKFSDLVLSLSTLQQCDSLIDKIRQQSSNESDKISLGVIANEVYADGVRISKETATVALQKNKFEELAFYFAEKSKSAVLLEAISESDAKSFAGIPGPLLEEEKALKASIALTAQKLAQKPSPEEERHLRESAFTLNRSYNAFVKRLETEFPSYFNLKFNAASPSIDQLQSVLNTKTAMISYFTDDKNKRLYIFLITKKSFKIEDHALPDDFDRSITAIRNGLYYNVIGPYTKAAQKLSRLLIPSSIPARIEELVILPMGRLSIVPFETLLTKRTSEEKSFKDLPYLLNDFNIRYEFSAGLLLQKKKLSVAKPESIFLCAPVDFPEKDNLNTLPGTASEVNAISSLFAAKDFKNEVLIYKEANESRVKGNSLKNYNILHFATHGVVDEADPQLSRIFLQNTSPSEDGNLFAGEIYNLEMDANLVTLSACQTGLGKISKGEGVIGLSRALVYAGAKNIIVSFWSVADESTSQLMQSFYKGLLDHPLNGYGDNLRQAKLSLLNSEKYSSPYYWAPFILIGF